MHRSLALAAASLMLALATAGCTQSANDGNVPSATSAPPTGDPQPGGPLGAMASVLLTQCQALRHFHEFPATLAPDPQFEADGPLVRIETLVASCTTLDNESGAKPMGFVLSLRWVRPKADLQVPGPIRYAVLEQVMTTSVGFENASKAAGVGMVERADRIEVKLADSPAGPKTVGTALVKHPMFMEETESRAAGSGSALPANMIGLYARSEEGKIRLHLLVSAGGTMQERGVAHSIGSDGFLPAYPDIGRTQHESGFTLAFLFASAPPSP